MRLISAASAWQSKNTRTWVAYLCLRRYRAHFHMAKAQQRQPRHDADVFVKTGSDAEHVGEGQPTERDRMLRQRPSDAPQNRATRS